MLAHHAPCSAHPLNGRAKGAAAIFRMSLTTSQRHNGLRPFHISFLPLCIPACGVANVPAFRSSQSSSLHLKSRCGIGRLIRHGTSVSGRICERGGRSGADRPMECATSCAANIFMPSCNALNRVSCRQNDDLTIRADNPAGVSFSRKSWVASEAGARIGRRRGRGRCSAGAVRLALSHLRPARMLFWPGLHRAYGSTNPSD